MIGNQSPLRAAIEAKLGPPIGQHGGDTDYRCIFCAKRNEIHTLHINYEKTSPKNENGEPGVAICHSCEYKTASLTRLVRDIYDGMPGSIRRLLERGSLILDVESILAPVKTEEEQRVELPASFQRIPYRGKGIARKLRRYLEGRGFEYDDIDRYGLGYFADTRERAYGYVIFPFYVGGRCVYWQGRRVAPLEHHFSRIRYPDGPPKSFNPKNTGKKWLLYGFDEAVKAKTCMLVEGPLDTIACWKAPEYAGLGLTSKTLQPEQIRAISMMGFDRIIIVLDPDTWKDMVPLHERSQKKVPRPFAMMARLRSAISEPVGILKLEGGDPAELKDRIHRLAYSNTKWYEHDVVADVERILA